MENKAVLTRHRLERREFSKRRADAGLKDQAVLDKARSVFYEAKAEYQTAKHTRSQANNDWRSAYAQLLERQTNELADPEVVA